MYRKIFRRHLRFTLDMTTEIVGQTYIGVARGAKGAMTPQIF